MRIGGISDPRNKSLMKMFNMINVGERAGSGVPNIINTWADAGLKEPIIEEQFNPDRTILILSLEEKGAKLSNRQTAKPSNRQIAKPSGDQTVGIDVELQERMLEKIANKPTITIKKLSSELEIPLRTMERYIQKLHKRGVIKRVGGKRYGHWEIEEPDI